MSDTGSKTPLYSAYKGDPDMQEIVDIFVSEMSERVSELNAGFQSQNWAHLRTIAHQLKGAAGGYGFEPLGNAAASLEGILKEDDPNTNAIEREFQTLTDLCNRVAA